KSQGPFQICCDVRVIPINGATSTGASGTDGQWYLHLFDATQPDLNWDNPDIAADLERTLRFWLDRGIAGFRIDVAHGMAKPSDLPDMADPDGLLLATRPDDPRFNNDGVHAIHRGIRKVFDDYPETVAVGE
ncbi:alpha-amylase family glycosyl hydrolase, partial [Mycolicibacterium sp. CBMA 361]|uniref:alpha-amylase family glycosyl hydrolase n=1 Tax=Mycolicibacterium sp. CBMA 361 TaxID=2606610 RepID=UPI0013A85778